MGQSILDILKPIGTTNATDETISLPTQQQQITAKRLQLTEYITNKNSTREDFNKIIQEYPDTIPYSMVEALNYCESNPLMFPMINNMINNISYYYRKDIGAGCIFPPYLQYV